MINLLLRNNFYPVMMYRRVRKEMEELLYTVLVARYGPQYQFTSERSKIDSFC